jgi:hypothetical protein
VTRTFTQLESRSILQPRARLFCSISDCGGGVSAMKNGSREEMPVFREITGKGEHEEDLYWGAEAERPLL